MKKVFIVSIAALLIAAPLAQAQAQHRSDHRKPQVQVQIKKSAPQKVVIKKHWSKGQRMNGWKKHAAVSDYKRHGLHRPSNGQRWVQVNNQFMLISITSGLIATIVAGR